MCSWLETVKRPFQGAEQSLFYCATVAVEGLRIKAVCVRTLEEAIDIHLLIAARHHHVPYWKMVEIQRIQPWNPTVGLNLMEHMLCVDMTSI